MPYNVSEIMDRAISSSSEGITLSEVSKPDQPLVYVNGGFERITGYFKNDIIGKNCRFLQGEETDKKEVEKIKAAINNRQSCTIEFINYKKNGEKFWNRLTVSPVSMPEDKAQYYVGVQCDITEIKEAQERITKYANELEKRNECIKEALIGFNDAIGRAVYEASSASKKLIANDIIKDEQIIKMLEKMHDTTENVNDLILNMRSAMTNLGGAEHLHNIDMVNFKIARKFTNEGN